MNIFKEEDIIWKKVAIVFILFVLAFFVGESFAANEFCFTTTDKGHAVLKFQGDLPVEINQSLKTVPMCSPAFELQEINTPEVDQCMQVVLTFFNTQTKQIDKRYYVNGATSLDGKTWEGVQNPLCPKIAKTVTTSVTYIKCADEYNRCNFTGTKTILYATSPTATSRVIKTFTDGVACTNEAFGSDPAKTQAKKCYVKSP